MKSHCVTFALLVLVASVNAFAQQSQQQLESLIQGYSIVLVQGDMQGGTATDGVPKAAQQALNDMKDFLPYKSYSLLDSGWVLGPGNAHVRLRGPSGQDLEATIARWPDPARPQELRIQFQLRDAVGVPRQANTDSPQLTELINRLSTAQSQRQQLTAQYESAKKRYDDNHPDVRALIDRLNRSAEQIDNLRREIERMKPTQGAEHTIRVERTVLISNSFTMRVGETVVVGTSRSGGDKALIALLTAVPRTAGKE
jgi:hypothetical protein